MSNPRTGMADTNQTLSEPSNITNASSMSLSSQNQEGRSFEPFQPFKSPQSSSKAPSIAPEFIPMTKREDPAPITKTPVPTVPNSSSFETKMSDDNDRFALDPRLNPPPIVF